MFLTLLWPLLSLLPLDEKPQNHLHIGQSLVSLLWAYMLLLGLFPSHEVRYLLITVKRLHLVVCRSLFLQTPPYPRNQPSAMPVFCLFVDLYIDGSDGIMTGASRAKPIAVRLEFCLPFWF